MWIEIHDIVDALFGYEVEQSLCQIPMWIQYRYTATLLNVLDKHVLKQCGLSHARFANHVNVMAAISLLDTERLLVISPVGCSNDGDGHTPSARTTRRYWARTSGLESCGSKACSPNSKPLCIGLARRLVRDRGV